MLPKIAITLGDPAGIGPEIVAKALLNPQIHKLCTPVVIGDARLLPKKLLLNKKNIIVNIPAKLSSINIGKPSIASGIVSHLYICTAVELALKGEISGIVTAPISKEAFSLAGIKYSGHTELLASLAKAKNVVMLMQRGKINVLLLTRHLPICAVSKNIKKDVIVRDTILSYSYLKEKMAIKSPRVAVLSLNPHAGDGGVIGKEEQTIILPAVNELRRKKINVIGPLPSDSAWQKAVIGNFDLLIAMYHDQAMIGLKMLKNSEIVNITLGLNFVRTSPGHGTAYDIAGKNLADPNPMIEAIKTAVHLCSN